MVIGIGGRSVGAPSTCFVIAEAGVNHNGDVGVARTLVEAAADAGADAVKFQTFEPAALASPDAPKATYQERSGSGASQREMLDALVLPREAHRELQQLAARRGIQFLSSPFDERSADFLAELEVPALKVPSGELTNHPFLAYLARKRLPLLVSTGMCDLQTVAEAVAAIRRAADVPFALFHCVSSYPAAPVDANLAAMATLRASFGVPVGWSDHTPGIHVAVAAAALGAELIEKHLTLDRTMPGPDHAASLEPGELREMVRGIREAQLALGDGVKRPVAAELEVARVARKSLHLRCALPPGGRIGAGDLVALRPGTGIPPSRSEELVGRVVRRGLDAGHLLREEDLEP